MLFTVLRGLWVITTAYYFSTLIAFYLALFIYLFIYTRGGVLVCDGVATS